MFWRSIPRATEVFAPALDPPPPANPAASAGQSLVPPRTAEGLVKTSDRALALDRTPDESPPRLKNAVTAVFADTRRPGGPQHLPDVVHEATAVKRSKRKSFVGGGLKRTKSVVSLFRRDSRAAEPDAKVNGETVTTDSREPSPRQVDATSSNGIKPPLSQSNPRATGRSGLTNLGNSCYLAGVLQALLATTPLRRFFLEGEYLKEVRPGTNGDLAKAVAGVFDSMSAGAHRSVSPARIKEALEGHSAQYRDLKQQDAHECLLSLFDALHDELNLASPQPRRPENSPSEGTSLRQLPEVLAADVVWQGSRERDDSVIVDFFHGQTRNRLECLECHTTSSSFHPLPTLSLAIPVRKSRETVTLEACIAHYLQEEILQGENAWNCPGCRSPQMASKTVSVARLPQFLVIHLQRFAFLGPKTTTPIAVPLSGLELGGLLPPLALASPSPYDLHVPHEPRTSYDLYAAVCHHGQDGSGHYTTLVRDGGTEEDGEGWCEIDDEVVTRLETPDAIDEALLRAERSAYLLFYRIGDAA